MLDSRSTARFTKLRSRTVSTGQIGAIWGVSGIAVLLGLSILRVSSYAGDAFADGLTWYQWCSLAVATVALTYSEGYRGFQKRLAPKVAARAQYVRHHPEPVLVALSPVFCLGYFRSTRARKVGTLGVTLAIFAASFLMQSVPTPWRGIVDAGVAAGLTWGLCSVLAISARALASEDFPYPAGIPETRA